MLHFKCKSLFNGQPIKSILTGVVNASANSKTGPVVQQYILPDTTTPPYAMSKTEAESVCGSCPLHPTASGGCYVQRHQGSRAVAKTTYPDLNPAYLTGRVVRLGADGDPTSLPFDSYAQIFKEARAILGYTHNWRDCDPRWRQWLKASVESEEAAKEARELGWSTFRIRPAKDSPTMPREVVCRNETHGETCLECKLCANFVNIVVTAHGVGKHKIQYV